MHRRVWLNLGVTVVLLLAATFSSLVLGGLIGGTANAQMLFLLAVLLIARFTDGYLWSVGASIVSVPLVNYMFTYPYFSFNLTISGYLLTFLTMLAVCVGGNEKGVLALRPAHRRFVADAIGLLRGNLSGLERLPDLIAQHIGIPALLPARDSPVLCLA